MRPVRLLAVVVAALSLTACGSLSRDVYSASDLAGPPPKGLAELRFNASDSDAAIRFAEPARKRASAQRTFDVLALSGGGSNGPTGRACWPAGPSAASGRNSTSSPASRPAP